MAKIKIKSQAEKLLEEALAKRGLKPGDKKPKPKKVKK